MDPNPNQQGGFHPLLDKYLKITDTIIKLAAGTIAFLVGSALFRNSSQVSPHLPCSYLPALLFLGMSIAAALFFTIWLVSRYEGYLHWMNEDVKTKLSSGPPYSKSGYALTLALGYCSVVVFIIAYFWLGVSLIVGK